MDMPCEHIYSFLFYSLDTPSSASAPSAWTSPRRPACEGPVQDREKMRTRDLLQRLSSAFRYPFCPRARGPCFCAWVGVVVVAVAGSGAGVFVWGLLLLEGHATVVAVVGRGGGGCPDGVGFGGGAGICWGGGA